MNNNVNQQEIAKFSAMADDWWNINGSFALIHKLNPARIDYIVQQAKGLFHKNILDVGCGAGILSEALAQEEAFVDAIDLSEKAIKIAKTHAQQNNLTINYQLTSSFEHQQTHKNHYDIICCLEMLEHVPNPEKIIVDLANMLKKDGLLFISTINRNPKSYLFMIELIENYFKFLPKKTHNFNTFIQPNELISWAEKSGLHALDCAGYHYNPFRETFYFNDDPSVNYIITFKK